MLLPPTPQPALPLHLHTHCCAARRPRCLPSFPIPSLPQRPRERGREGTRLPGASPHPASGGPHGALALRAAHPPPPLPLPFSACCMKGAFDLNLSARIRVRSRSPPPSTEPHQGCEAASATAGYSRGASGRAAAVAGQGGTRR